ncbi:MAG: triose-phosphate isomerase [Flavobacteriaceae bacterium]|nr:triose-phosphate isomerase [Flavobacteriaceae bacterium]|tara:strand:- start:15483 stop:16232 length:750 start_codon:yes stop_codon:yes gene_type:complete
MRKKIVIGNWKMNNDSFETKTLLNKLIKYDFNNDVAIMVSPSFTNLQNSVIYLSDSKIEVIAQNVNESEKGAFTGEVSSSMLKSIGVSRSIIGHSERRSIYNETDNMLKKKINNALNNKLKIIFCFGEKINDRENNQQFELVNNQLSNTLLDLKKSDWENIILAYEPVWAIGTGENATPKQAQEMHFHVRNWVKINYGSKISNTVPILYGGSVKPNNASEIFSQPDVDGGLIGGASLNHNDFIEIINSF